MCVKVCGFFLVTFDLNRALVGIKEQAPERDMLERD